MPARRLAEAQACFREESLKVSLVIWAGGDSVVGLEDKGTNERDRSSGQNQNQAVEVIQIINI